MSAIKLIQRIRAVAKALQGARDAEDLERIEALEDELFNLEEQLEDEQQSDYDDKHQHGWR